MSGPLGRAEIDATAAWIASVQLPSGMIPWFPGGHADVWNHTEAAMALVLAGRLDEAVAAFEWSARTQLPDGSWCTYYLAEGVEEPRRDPNVAAYFATGLWWYHLHTGDATLLERLWPVVDAAMAFVLDLQTPGGEVRWSRDVDGRTGSFALLSANASISHSLRCAAALGAAAGHDRAEWELAAARVVAAVVERPGVFRPKDRWAMDWYYPVLCGALDGPAAAERLDSRWEEFCLEGVGIRCVVDQPWVTAAETAECAMAHAVAGRHDRARQLLGWTRHLRHEDGAYWTGCVHPQCVRYPGGERSTYSAAAVLLADHVLHARGAGSDLFAARPGSELDLPGSQLDLAEPLADG